MVQEQKKPQGKSTTVGNRKAKVVALTGIVEEKVNDNPPEIEEE